MSSEIAKPASGMASLPGAPKNALHAAMLAMLEKVVPQSCRPALDRLQALSASPLEELASIALAVLHKPYGTNYILELHADFGISCACFQANEQTSFHLHHRRSEFYFVRTGRLDLYREHHVDILTAGQYSHTIAGDAHKLFNPGPDVLEVMEVFSPALLDDKFRLSDEYGRYLGKVDRFQ